MSTLTFAETEFVYRGQTFKLKEVDTATYDECLKKATKTVFDQMGEETERVEENLLLRLLLEKSLVEPKLTSADFGKLGVRLTRQLERDVRELHFNTEPQTKKDAARKKGQVDDDDAGDPKAEG